MKRRMPKRITSGIFAIPLIIAALFAPGCAEPGPRLAPAVPIETHSLGDSIERLYDMNADGNPDYSESLNDDGQITLLKFDPNNDGNFEETVQRLRAGHPDSNSDRQLVVLLDSIPYNVVRDAWDAGHFRLFPPPSRTISPFPVMTDLSFSEFFGVSPSPGAESEYYDSGGLHDGYNVYAAEGNAPWVTHTDYHLQFIAHGVAYLWPDIWYDHEMGKIQRQFYKSTHDPFVGYVVTTSGLGATQGRNGHQKALVKLDQFCQAVMFELHGHVQITLMSDHGHCLLPSKRIPLTDLLKKFGYHVTRKLKDANDVVVPEFGVVNYAGVYTGWPDQVATDLLGVDGVDLTLHLDHFDAVVVQSRDGRARIRRMSAGTRYECQHGDPLKLLPIIENLRSQGKIGLDDFIDDQTFFEATKDHIYPDAIHRIWRAFHGLMVNPPDVMVSVQDGWHCGSALMTKLVDVSAAHGSLNLQSSCGFAMTTNGPLPPVMRMESLRKELERVGVQFRGDESDDHAAAKP